MSRWIITSVHSAYITTAMKKNLIYLSFLFLFIIACKEKTFEHIAEAFPDGSPRIVDIYERKGNDSILLEEKVFHPNGKIYIQGKFKDNKKDSTWSSFYPDGGKWSETGYKNDINNGPTTSWYPNGQKHYTGFYTDGKPSGHWTFWDENGVVTSEKIY